MLKKTFSPFVAIATVLIAPFIFAAVEYPSVVQPGVAYSSNANGVYKLENNMLSASFSYDGGKLKFSGAPALGILESENLFSVTFGDGTTVESSEMTLNGVPVLENLNGNPNAVKISERFDGKLLRASFTYTKNGTVITVEWSAILRNGSHYLRTALSISATADIAMKKIVAMQYTSEGGIPTVVGNTRGSPIVGERFFAGLETPMGINAIGTSSSPEAIFNYSGWVPLDWAMDADAPAGVAAIAGTPMCKRGYVNVDTSSSTSLVVTFNYQSGTHKLNTRGVDLVDTNGNVVASDYHTGYTGGSQSNKVYTLTGLSSGLYTLRYWADNVAGDEINSTGNIAITGATLSIPSSAPLSWTPASWVTPAADSIPADLLTQKNSYNSAVTAEQMRVLSGAYTVVSAGRMTITFNYASGNHRMNLMGVDLVDSAGNVVAQDYHSGFTGGAKSNNEYTLDVAAAGNYTLRYWADVATETITSSGDISVAFAGNAHTDFTGTWSRNTTLKTGETWNVSAVVGLYESEQRRRSFLAYNERERAVPWRSFVHYNSWYELNINRNNNLDGRYTEAQCLEVLTAWKTNLYDKYDVGINAYAWDDGWDNFNSLWDFYTPTFPNGFSVMDEKSREMGAGTGTWLGPVGGYGGAKTNRINYWNNTHPNNRISNFQLSNKEYFDAFVGRCSQMVDDYDMRYFKFDGISTTFHATGPGGEEDAEGIIKVLTALRKKREDIFFNCTVGTWASPFFFHYADSVWRQENDYGESGEGANREKWITYRDNLVYDVFVTGGIMCPINSLMTHGLIVTKYGPPSSMARNDSAETARGIKKEMHCAFACGSGLVELYVDNDLMSTIGEDGELWAELAKCIKWHRKNADVLDDIHWVGGDPNDGTNCNIYGWASWNKNKSTLALRNPSGTQKTLTGTLRQLLDIPAFVGGKIRLKSSFGDESTMDSGQLADYDIDTEISFTIPAYEAFFFDGRPVAGTYNEWAANAFSEDPTADNSETGNPSGDGISNFAKYIFGLDPLANEVLTPRIETAVNILKITFPRLEGTDNVTFSAQCVKSDGSGWESEGVGVTIDESVAGEVSVTLNASMLAAEKQAVRLTGTLDGKTFTTEPYGYELISVPAKATTKFGLRVHKPFIFQKEIPAATNPLPFAVAEDEVTITDADLPAKIDTTKSYIVEILTEAVAGTRVSTPVIVNRNAWRGLTDMTIDEAAGTVTFVCANLVAYLDQTDVNTIVGYRIREASTLSDVFGSAAESGLKPGTSRTADMVKYHILDKNLWSFWVNSGNVFDAGSLNGVGVKPAATPIFYHRPIQLQRRENNVLSFILTGEVLTDSQEIHVYKGDSNIFSGLLFGENDAILKPTIEGDIQIESKL